MNIYDFSRFLHEVTTVQEDQRKRIQKLTNRVYTHAQ